MKGPATRTTSERGPNGDSDGRRAKSAFGRIGEALERWLPMPLIVVVTAYLRLTNLGHRTVSVVDEACHALVGRNLLRHPLEPTLLEKTWLPFDYRNWTGNHVWLHKPILPLWQIALSFAAFGVNAFALRLPSAILATGAVMLTYLIGRDLFDRRAGWIAAAFQGISPTIQRLVQGYLFSDHIDVALLFWTELGIYFGLRAIRGGHMRDAVVSGIACGLAYLSKYFLALLVPALLLATLILVRLRLIEPAAVRLRLRHAIACMLVAGLTAAPWLLWCFVHFRRELVHEHLYALAHLTGEKEGWAAPWDRLLADYWPMMQAYLFMPVVVAAALLGFTSWRKSRLSLWFVGSWIGIVVLPHILAASKTPTGTVLSIPAGCLMFGALLSAATRSDVLAAAGCIAGSFAGLFGSRDLAKYGKGPAASGGFGGVLLEADWLITQAAVAAACMAGMLCAGWILMRFRKQGARVPDQPIRAVLATVAIALAATLAGMSVKESWRVVTLNRSEGSYIDLGTWVKSHLEPNAVLLLDVSRANEAVLATLWSDRTCYATTLTELSAVGGKVKQADGIPYIVSRKRLANLNARYTDPTDGWIVYDWSADAGLPTPIGK